MTHRPSSAEPAAPRRLLFPIALGALALAWTSPAPAAAQGVTFHAQAGVRARGDASFRASLRAPGRPRGPRPVAPPTVGVPPPRARASLRIPRAGTTAVQVPGVAGGTLSARALGAPCDGFVSASPNHTLLVDGPAVVRLSVVSGPASLVLLRGPGGALSCVDARGRGPLMFEAPVTAGTHQVFVGTRRAGHPARGYALRVETLTTGHAAWDPAPIGRGDHIRPRPGRWSGIPAPVLRRLTRAPLSLYRDNRLVASRVWLRPDGRVTGHPRAHTWTLQGRQLVVFDGRGRPLARFDRGRMGEGRLPVVLGRDRRGRDLVLRQRPHPRRGARPHRRAVQAW